MGNIYQVNYLVPAISKIEKAKTVQAAVHAYLLDQKIIKAELAVDDYGQDYYPLDIGFKAILNPRSFPEDADKQNYLEQVQGVFYVRKKRHVFGNIDDVLSLTCPSCHVKIGVESCEIDIGECDDPEEAMEQWQEEAHDTVYPLIKAWEKGQDEVACPHCDKKHEINQYTFENHAAFSNFGVAFLEGVPDAFTPAFLEALQAIIGHELMDIGDYA